MDGVPSYILDETPAMVAPDGQTSNLINPPDLFVTSVVSSTFGLALTLSFFSIRMFTKCFLLKKLYMEDYTCAIGVVLYIALVSSIYDAGLSGAGRHQWNVSLSQAMRIGYGAYWGEIAFSFGIGIAKISILQQIRRIFAPTRKTVLYILCTILIWLNGGFYLAGSLAGIFTCTPREATWNPFVQGTCINKMMLVVVSCAINVLSDIGILIIPIACTWNLVLPLKRKIAIAAIFATGIFSLGIAILKLVITIPLLTTSDITYTINIAALCAEAEVATVTICGCLPCVPRFIQALRRRPVTTDSYAWSFGTYGSGASKPLRRPFKSTSSQSTASTVDEKPRLGFVTAANEKARLEMAMAPPSVGASIVRPLPAAAQRVPPSAFARRLMSVAEDDVAGTSPHVSNSIVAPSNDWVSSERLSPASNPFATPQHDRSSPTWTRNPVAKTDAPIAEMEDTSCPPISPLPKRKRSLSERASTPTGQRAMQALAGRFWRDSEDRGRDGVRSGMEGR